MKKETVILDAEDCTMGRLAAFAAAEALKDKKVIVFNAEKAIISGKEKEIFKDYKKRYAAKSATNPRRYGPKRPKNADRFLRRVIRGMLPWDKARGKAAFKNVMVYIGKPGASIKKKEGIDISKEKLYDTKGFKGHYDYFITIGRLCQYLGGKE